jgi:hypothetical protein
MSKAMNHKRRMKALEKAKAPKARDLNALALILARKGGHHGDARKERSKKACRGRAREGRPYPGSPVGVC